MAPFHEGFGLDCGLELALHGLDLWHRGVPGHRLHPAEVISWGMQFAEE
jgi:hypothetical protein